MSREANVGTAEGFVRHEAQDREADQSDVTRGYTIVHACGPPTSDDEDSWASPPMHSIADYIAETTINAVDTSLGYRSTAWDRTPLGGRRVPFKRFVWDVIRRASVKIPVLLVALVYTVRAKPHLNIETEDWACERVFLGALVVASKVDERPATASADLTQLEQYPSQRQREVPTVSLPPPRRKKSVVAGVPMSPKTISEFQGVAAQRPPFLESASSEGLRRSCLRGRRMCRRMRWSWSLLGTRGL